MNEWVVFLEPGETKNETGRMIYLDDDLLKLLKGQNLRHVEGCPYVFDRKGKPIRSFRKAWEKPCKAAGQEGKLFHDFRPTAVRNLTCAGNQESVAMKITGHKTRSVFDRYNITSQEDLRRAAEQQAEYLRGQTVTKSVTIGENDVMEPKKAPAQLFEIK